MVKGDKMDRNATIDCLRRHEAELRSSGVRGVSLFGSMARQEADPADVDIAVQLTPEFSRGGLHYFGQLEDLRIRFSRMLGSKVDIVEEPTRKSALQNRIDRDRAVVF
jgi:hypothetical protein